MSNVIDFSELVPERLRVNNLPDGSSLELMHASEMGPEEMAAVQHMQHQLAGLEGAAGGSQEDQLALVNKQNDVAGEMLRLIAPGMTDETLGSLKMGQRGAILRWWTEQAANGQSPKAAAQPRRSSKRRG